MKSKKEKAEEPKQEMPKGGKLKLKKPKSEAYVMKKNTGMKILRAALWLILVFVFIKGVFSIFQRDKTQVLEQMIQDFKANYSDFTNQNQEVTAFAQSFVREYLTYEVRGEEEYKERLNQYVAANFFRESVLDFKASAEAVYVNAYRMEDYSQTQKDVYVQAQVQYVKRVLQQDGQTYTEVYSRQPITLKVPVYCSGGSYVVESVPMVVSDSVYLGQYTPEDYYNTAVSEEEAAVIRLSVENFLKAYCEQDKSVINYYLDSSADKTEFEGLGGRFIFREISKIKCYQYNGSVICLVEFKIQDSENDAVMLQKINLTMRETGGKYYIESMNTRTGNLNF